jgi:cysteine-rich repeat protein
MEACEESDDCRAPQEDVAEATAALSFAASRVYAIGSLYYQSGGCQHGSIATDSQARCNSPSDVVLAHFTGLTACTPANASLTFQRQEWQQATTVTVRASLRPVVDPPAGVSSACADAYAGAKWDSTGAGQAWTTPGARGIGTDVTAASAVVTVPVNGTQTVTVPLGSVVAGCAAAGECVIVLDADHHVWEYQGTFSLFYDCASPPPVCGDGTKAGAEPCDDGNVAAGDGCSALCAIESGWTCTGSPSVCATVCGDGVVAGAEECDDGNASNADACSTSCESQVCTWQ